MTTDDHFTVPEIRIEECVADVVDQMWEIITSDNDIILDRITDLAADLGLDPHQIEHFSKYEKLLADVIRACWVGLISKVAEELTQLAMQDLEKRFS